MNEAHNPTTRFSNRVTDYVKHRPGYPAEVITLLTERANLTPGAVVADLGAGTGIFTRMLLDAGATVYAVEPNAPMLQAARDALADEPRFHPIEGRAESLPLPDAAVDLVTAAQAFHWFDPVPARRELDRVLRPGGYVALIWNDRDVDASPFQAGYEHILRTLTPEYEDVTYRNLFGPTLDTFFAPHGYALHTFPNAQRFDLNGLLGRFTSSSYAPRPEDPRYDEAHRQLTALFNAHVEPDGAVCFAYKTRVYLGVLTA